MHPTLERGLIRVRGLPPTSRLLIASVVVILVMGLFLVSLYSGRRDLVPLGLKSSLDADARAETIAHLEAHGIRHEVRGVEIRVPPEQKLALLAELADGDVITPAQIDFDGLVQDDSPFRSRAQNERRWLVATMNVLSRMISRLDGVERAGVVIDEPGRPGGLGAARVPPSASVTVIPRGGPLSQDQVDAIAALVAGAHAELTPEHVAVVDARAGRSYRSRTADTLRATTHLELQQATEERVREKLATALDYIPGVNVAVHVVVDTREETQRISTYEEPQIGVVSETTSSRSGGSPWDGPGLIPSADALGMSASPADMTGTEDRSTAEMEARFPSTERNVRDPKGYALQINATIGVPRSYFTRLLADRPPGADPGGAGFDDLVRSETERIRAQIDPLVDMRAIEGAVAGTISVSMIPDFAAVPTNAAPVSIGAAAPGVTGDPVLRYAGLGGLALASLVAMIVMMRRAGVRGRPEQITTETEQGVPAADPLETEGDAAPAPLEAARLLDRLNEHARTSPRETAFLLRKWMTVES